MRSKIFRPTRWGLALIVAALLVAPLSASTRSVTAAGAGGSGIVCTTGPAFNLTATDGYILLPDGNTVYMWSYADSNSTLGFQYPGPVLCVNEGDTVTITLTNNLAVPTSIIFPGQSNVLANGSPAQPEFSGSTLTSLANSAAPNGGTATYSFTADQPGTFIYQSGTDYELQAQMGLVGALVVRPALGADYAYNRADSQFATGQEYLLLMSELDPDLHLAIERGETFDITTYHPRYWMLNGRGFPDAIAPNGAAWLPTQPYSALVHIEVYDAANNPYPALIRHVNVGTVLHPFHPHGENGRVIGRDGHALEGPAGQDLSYEKFTFSVAPGQTVDVTWKFTDVEQWNPNTNPIPVTELQGQNQVYGELFGSPYLGGQTDLPTGQITFNECGEFYHIWHSHAVQEVAAFGLPMGGMATVVRIDPPGGCAP